MPDPNKGKECGIFGNFVAGDPVIWMRTQKRYRVVKVNLRKVRVPRGHIPIKLEELGPHDRDAIVCVPIDDIIFVSKATSL